MIPASLGAAGWAAFRLRLQREREESRRALSERVTDSWPDPHGPDPVVFGPAPRTREAPGA